MLVREVMTTSPVAVRLGTPVQTATVPGVPSVRVLVG